MGRPPVLHRLGRGQGVRFHSGVDELDRGSERPFRVRSKKDVDSL
jgi:hypothetical protein